MRRRMSLKTWRALRPVIESATKAGRSQTIAAARGRVSLPAIATIAGDALVITIPRELESPNRDRGAHWSVRHRKSEAWEQEIVLALGRRLEDWQLPVVGQTKTGRPRRQQVRTKVEVTRYVDSRRRFIRDDDNLAFSVKPLHDALKRLGLIYDDNRRWLEVRLPAQEVGDTRTVVIISRPRLHAVQVPDGKGLAGRRARLTKEGLCDAKEKRTHRKTA